VIFRGTRDPSYDFVPYSCIEFGLRFFVVGTRDPMRVRGTIYDGIRVGKENELRSRFGCKLAFRYLLELPVAWRSGRGKGRDVMICVTSGSVLSLQVECWPPIQTRLKHESLYTLDQNFPFARASECVELIFRTSQKVSRL